MKNDQDLKMARLLDRRVGACLLRALGWLIPAGGDGPLPDPGIRRILVLKLHGIGNLVLMLPAIRALRDRFPGAEVDLLTLASNREICRDLEEVHHAYFLEGRSIGAFLSSTARVLPALRRRRYDLAVDFEQFAMVTPLLSAWSGAPHRIGFSTPGLSRDGLYTRRVGYRDSDHMSRIFLRLAHAAGAATTHNPSGALQPTPEGWAEACSWLGAAGIADTDVAVILHPGSSPNLVLRRWPPQRFGELAERLSVAFGAKCVLTGVAGEEELAKEIAAAATTQIWSAVAQLSFEGFVALCARAEVVVSNDTSSVHIASAVGSPVVGLYGPNTPFLYGPVGAADVVLYHPPPCSPCLLNVQGKVSSCRRAQCMEAITVDEVFDAISRAYFLPGGKIRPHLKKARCGARPPRSSGAGVPR